MRGFHVATRACDAVLLLDHRSSLSGCVLASELSRRARSFDSRRSARISDSQLRLTFPLSVIGMRSTYSMRSGQRRFARCGLLGSPQRRSRWDAPRRTRRRTGKCAHRVADRACRWLHGFRCRDIRVTASSTSAALMFSPPRMMISLRLPLIRMRPRSSIEHSRRLRTSRPS